MSRTCCGNARSITYQVRLPDGTLKKYPSEIEAKTAANSTGGTYERIER